MQTFLPYKSFKRSAQVLDYRRLGKQRVEGLQIINVLQDYDNARGWKYHPAVLMWKGYEKALIEYIDVICDEWVGRGYKDTIKEKIAIIDETITNKLIYPEWLGKYTFHKSHKSNLLRKDFEYYSKFWSQVPDNLPYIWPVTKDTVK